MNRLCGRGVPHSSYRAWHYRPKTVAPEEERLHDRVKDAHALSIGSSGPRAIAKTVTAE